MFEAFWGLPKSCQITLLLQRTCVLGSRSALGLDLSGVLDGQSRDGLCAYARCNFICPFGECVEGASEWQRAQWHWQPNTAQIAPSTSGHHNSSAEIIKTHMYVCLGLHLTDGESSANVIFHGTKQVWRLYCDCVVYTRRLLCSSMGAKGMAMCGCCIQ